MPYIFWMCPTPFLFHRGFPDSQAKQRAIPLGDFPDDKSLTCGTMRLPILSFLVRTPCLIGSRLRVRSHCSHSKEVGSNVTAWPPWRWPLLWPCDWFSRPFWADRCPWSTFRPRPSLRHGIAGFGRRRFPQFYAASLTYTVF